MFDQAFQYRQGVDSAPLVRPENRSRQLRKPARTQRQRAGPPRTSTGAQAKTTSQQKRRRPGHRPPIRGGSSTTRSCRKPPLPGQTPCESRAPAGISTPGPNQSGRVSSRSRTVQEPRPMCRAERLPTRRKDRCLRHGRRYRLLHPKSGFGQE